MKVQLRNELKELLERPRETGVSIYMPMQRPMTTLDGPARLSNLLDQAEKMLVKSGMRDASARKLLEPGRALQTDGGFWRNQVDGLAMFIAADFFRTYRIPFGFPELTVASTRFHIKPLIKLFVDEPKFFMLALSQNSVRLVRCARDSFSVVTPEKTPASLDDFLRYDSPELYSSYHASGSKGGSPGRSASIMHGQMGGPESKKDHLPRFFKEVNKSLQDLLKDETAPMIIAGADFLHAIYQKENTYPHLLLKGIEGNPDIMPLKTLQEKGLDIAEEVSREQQRKALAKYESLAGSKQAAGDVSQVVIEAHNGHVFKLFVAMEEQRWGCYDPENRKVTVHDKPEPGDVDLLDLAAERALVTGASVYVMPPDEMPRRLPVAAILRFAHTPAAA